MTDSRDPRLDGRYPEFARMSLRPGIGFHAMHEVASVLMQHGLEKSLADVPNSLAHGRKMSLLGRYLRRNLRLMVGKDAKAPVDPEVRSKMLAMLTRSILAGTSLKGQSVAETEGKALSLIGRTKLYKGRKVL